MQRNYKPPFKHFVKKQHTPLRMAIEDAVDEVCSNPKLGEGKTGDLQGIRVYKFTHKTQEYLIAYRPPTDEAMAEEGVEIELLIIDFYQVGVHENFYADLKNYLKS